MSTSRTACTRIIGLPLVFTAALCLSAPIGVAQELKSAGSVRVMQSKKGDQTVLSITKGRTRVASFTKATRNLSGVTICCEHDDQDDFWVCSESPAANICDIVVECTDDGICTPTQY